MDKMKLAHDWAMKYGSPESFKLTVDKAWKYADAMQAEADKRSISLTKDKDGNCLHFHHEFGHERCMDCGASLEEWQPDWSQVPSNMNYFAVGANGDGWFYEGQPTMGRCSWFVRGNNDNCKTPNNSYKGNWKDSLRKRPGSK